MAYTKGVESVCDSTPWDYCAKFCAGFIYLKIVNPKVTNDTTKPTELIMSDNAGGTDHAERFFEPFGSTYTTSFG